MKTILGDLNFGLCVLLWLSLSACAHGSGPTKATLAIGNQKVELVQYSASLPGQYFFVGGNESPEGQKTKSSIYVFDTDGKIRFSRSLPPGHPPAMLSGFRPLQPNGFGYFRCVPSKTFCDDASFHLIDENGVEDTSRITPRSYSELNFHDMTQSKRGTSFFLFTKMHLDDQRVDNVIEEWDSNGRVSFRWNIEDHLDELKIRRGHNFFHFNSIDLDPDGNIIVSLLQQSRLLRIEVPSGRILNTVNGADWKFPNDEYGGFRHQHSAHVLPNGHLFLFDNGDGRNGRRSRAVEYALDEKNRTAHLVWEYRYPDQENKHRISGGNVQRLPNGNTVISWGSWDIGAKASKSNLVLSEISPKGTVVREIRGPYIALWTFFGLGK
ncbi:MAG: aryl-sulfate sulfotransferase [Bdellovibrionota bacterium]